MGKPRAKRDSTAPKILSVEEEIDKLRSDPSGDPNFDNFDPLMDNADIVGPIITSPEDPRASGTTGVEPLDPDSDYASLGYTLSNYHKPVVEPILETSTDRLLKQNMDALNEDSQVFKKPKVIKKPVSTGKRPAFIVKLWNMVNDEKNHKYITWMDDGEGFHVLDRERFMKFVLPQYFKHNNFASFVRQLNMYGFHKIQDITQGSLAQSDEIWQFSNPDFKKDREDLLDNIVRNKPKDEAVVGESEVDIKQLLSQLEIMKSNQKLIADDLIRVRRDNEMLWKENFLAREKHKLQSETLDKILRFLASVYGNNTSKLLDQVNNVPLSGGVLDLQPIQRNNKYQNDYNWYDNFAEDLQQQHNLQQQQHQQQPQQQPQQIPTQSAQLYPQTTGGGMNRQPLMITERAHGSFSSSSSARPKLDELTPSDFNGVPTIQELTDSPNDKKFPIPIKQYSQIPSQPNTPELIIGNINQHLDDNDNAINQVNDWITRYTKPDGTIDEEHTGSTVPTSSGGNVGDDFLQSPLDLDLDNEAFLTNDLGGDNYTLGVKRPSSVDQEKGTKKKK